ncbi:MAG: sulfotransferase [Gammaproteobacteria bacterium]
MSLSEGYNFVDRALHHVAFSTSIVHSALDQLECDLYSRQLEAVTTKDEVFVTGLPRAGTTLILELLYGTGEFATYTYRHMPFIRAPLIWDRVTRRFQRVAKEGERAHGDGMKISFDSPEAFEEVVWLHHLRERIVKDDYLSPLCAEEGTAEFAEAMRAAICKLLLLESAPNGSPLRYLSKNNANVSRVDLIASLFPSCMIVVPFRKPLAHVSSLMTQHRQFTLRHHEDAFARRYMKWLGHHDFGEHFKPINFDGWLDANETGTHDEIDFWLAYWLATYTYIYRYVTDRAGDRVMLIDYDMLLEKRGAVLEAIAERLRLREPETLISSAGQLRSPTTLPIESDACSSAMLEAAESLHRRLTGLALH